MKQICAIMYFTILIIIHIQAQLAFLQLPVPIYVTAMLIIVVAFMFGKRLSLNPSPTILFTIIQALICSIYFMVKPSFIYAVLFVLFILLEWQRIAMMQHFFSLQSTLRKSEEQQQHFNETFRVVRQERHDFLKHAAAMHYLTEKNEHEAIKSYLNELVEGYEETNLSIKGERGVIAGILHEMYKRAKTSNIAIVYDFDIPCSHLPLHDTHLVALLGNLLSNSIEACQEWQQMHKGQGTISLQLYKRSGLYILNCKNNTVPLPASVADHLFEQSGITTKMGHDGLGTSIIHDIVKHYNGHLDFIYKNEEFSIKLKFPAIL